MFIETTWQTTRPSVTGRVTFLLNNDHLSDVKFVAANSNGESKQVIPAHKFILAIGSPVFEAMFYGELAETKDTIELPDCDYESLLELFRYIYTDEVNLSGSNVMAVLYLAKKYIVPSLADKCMEYLNEKINSLNAFSILPWAQKYEEKSLVDRCWKVIENQTEAAVESEGFETIGRSLLEEVVARDNLSIKEVSLFQAVDRWATTQCEKQGLAEDGPIKRRILGEEMIKALRFPVMTGEEFVVNVVDTNILTSDEVVTLFKYFIVPTSPTLVAFSKTPRGKLTHAADCMTSCRFPTCTPTSWNYHGERSDLLCFSVDKNVTLHGLRLFGSENNSYTVTLKVTDTGSRTTVVSKSGTYYPKLLHSKRFSYHGFEVMFDSAAVLKNNTSYLVEALISGPWSGKGDNGLGTVKASSVTFTFSSVYREDSNNTNVNGGQFPEILFSQ